VCFRVLNLLSPILY